MRAASSVVFSTRAFDRVVAFASSSNTAAAAAIVASISDFGCLRNSESRQRDARALKLFMIIWLGFDGSGARHFVVAIAPRVRVYKAALVTNNKKRLNDSCVNSNFLFVFQLYLRQFLPPLSRSFASLAALAALAALRG